MSAAGASDSAHGAHGHDDHGHDHDHDGVAYHGTMKDYLTGFTLSVILTAIPFWIIMGDVFRSPITAAVVVMIFAVAQIFVHMVYFLHMNPKSEGGWNLLAAIFTIVVVVIALSGSMWIMSHLHQNMAPMPAGGHEMTAPPAKPAPAKPPHK
ncbi:cytochrome o ubiquinol oxidase subunit IV [Methylopila sp. M107]|uniref:cytochrome o ubiquinol oxidase subunit IV n=1 Tax=Methylopila sp. M107 TaxID=1101190 RepID=UPI00036C0E4D|nr:cytochrome o ubiquinol oxidase subunit IV [Methylopila sp. M107]